MANTQAICTSFKTELMLGQHQLGASTLVSRTSLTAPTVDTIRAALYLASATVDATKTTYGGTVGSVADTGEVTGTAYTAGGVVVTNATAPTAASGTAYWTPSAALAWTAVTLATAFDAVLFFNNTQSNKAIAVFTFGSQTVTAGNFTLNMPANSNTTALIRIA